MCGGNPSTQGWGGLSESGSGQQAGRSPDTRHSDGKNWTNGRRLSGRRRASAARDGRPRGSLHRSQWGPDPRPPPAGAAPRVGRPQPEERRQAQGRGWESHNIRRHAGTPLSTRVAPCCALRGSDTLGPGGPGLGPKPHPHWRARAPGRDGWSPQAGPAQGGPGVCSDTRQKGRAQDEKSKQPWACSSAGWSAIRKAAG